MVADSAGMFALSLFHDCFTESLAVLELLDALDNPELIDGNLEKGGIPSAFPGESPCLTIKS